VAKSESQIVVLYRTTICYSSFFVNPQLLSYWKYSQSTSVKNTEKSIYHFKEFLKVEPQNIEVIGSIAWAYYGKSDQTNAIEYFNKSLAIKKENPGHWIGLGYCYQSWSLKQYEKAIECNKTALKYNPTLNQIADIEKHIQQCQDSLAKLQK